MADEVKRLAFLLGETPDGDTLVLHASDAALLQAVVTSVCEYLAEFDSPVPDVAMRQLLRAKMRTAKAALDARLAEKERT